MKRFILMIVMGLLLLAPLSHLQACPACKDNIEQAIDDRGQPVTKPGQLSFAEKAYSLTVLMLLIIPLTLAGILTKHIISTIAKEKES